MDLDSSIKRIKETYSVAHQKDSDVLIRYTGYSSGVTQPWMIVIDSYTTKGETWEKAVTEMFLLLKKDLEGKVKMAESQMQTFKKSLNRLTLD